MAGSVLKLSDVKLALRNADLDFKIETSDLNDAKDLMTFIDNCTKTKVRGKIVRSFNEGEMYHWPSLDHDNVARLIAILYIYDDISIYLTIHNEVTLKDIVHDENFVYGTGCFDRKRSYAKGILSGLSYLHGKSLALMNVCDDNIVISKEDDRAIITNFDHLTMQQKVTRSKLNIPEMYMAPETKNGRFDAIKAEIWACGILMVDMFLAHMVQWGVINYKPKKVIRIIDKISLDFLQAANAGSNVSEFDLAKFQLFLKRFFFKKNPLERTPVKYACIASFLQNRDQYNPLTDSLEMLSSPENILFTDYVNPNLIEEDLTIFINPTYDRSSPSKPPRTQRREIKNPTSGASTSKILQTKRSVEVCESKTEVDIALTGNLKSNIKVEKNNLPFSVSYTNAVPIVDEEITDNLEKTAKSCRTGNVDGEDEIELSYDCHQSKYFEFIKPEKSSNNTPILKLTSKENSCYLNSKPTGKQYLECDSENSEFGLNSLFNSNDGGFDYNTDHSAKYNSVVESDDMNVQALGKISKNLNTQNMRIEAEIKQSIPHNYEYKASVQSFEKPSVKVPSSKMSPFCITSEIESIINKIIFLRRCYISIETHQKIFVSKEFKSRQGKLIKEYQALLTEENLRLREILWEKNEVKFEDITKLMRIVDTKACPNKMNRKWNINGPLDNEKSKKVWEKNEFVPENKWKHELATLFPATIKSDKMLKQRQVARKTNEVKNQDKQREKIVKIVDKTNYDCGAHPKEPEKGNTKTAMIAGEINPKKVDEKMKKQEKKLRHDLKKLEAPKKSRFLSFMCPGGRVEKATPIVDALCETCKLNLEIS